MMKPPVRSTSGLSDLDEDPALGARRLYIIKLCLLSPDRPDRTYRYEQFH